jgi:hypothetical protein
MGQLIHTSIQLKEKGTGAPLQNVTVKLYDKDFINDDFLGSASPDANGLVSISFDIDAIKSTDSPLEQFPDLYFKIFKGDKEIYTSTISEDVDTQSEGTFSVTEGKTIDLGSYLIDAE